MKPRLDNTSWPRQAAVIAAALLILAVGFCLIHIDHHVGSPHGMCPDPCAMMVSSLALVLLSRPLVNGRLRFEAVRSLYAVSLHLLDPPPRSFVLASSFHV